MIYNLLSVYVFNSDAWKINLKSISEKKRSSHIFNVLLCVYKAQMFICDKGEDWEYQSRKEN